MCNIIRTGSVNDIHNLESIKTYEEIFVFEKLRSECRLWHNYIKMFNQVKHKKMVHLATWFDSQDLHKIFPEIKVLIGIYLTIPITSVSAERSFSVLKLLETYLRRDNKDYQIWQF